MNYVAEAFGTTTSLIAAIPPLSVPGVYLHLRQHRENSVKINKVTALRK